MTKIKKSGFELGSHNITSKNSIPVAKIETKASKNWVLDLSVGVAFVSVLAMVLSEYWKSWRKYFFQNDIIFTISSKYYHFKKIFPPAFFNILIKPLLVQIQMIPQQKGLILSFLELESLRVCMDIFMGWGP